MNPLLLPAKNLESNSGPALVGGEPSLPSGPLNPWVCLQEGMLQHWELGRALRQRYLGFLNTSYHRQEVRL